MRQGNRSLGIQLLAILAAMGCMTPVTAGVPREVTPWSFERHEVALGSDRHQTVLPGFFLGGEMADLAVVSIDGNGDRRLRVYGLEGGAQPGWVRKLEANLGPAVLFVDVADVGGRDRLVTFERGRLHWFDPETETLRSLVEITTRYNAADNLEGSATMPGGKVPAVDVTRDLNHDGREDLIVPDLDGFWISTQRSDGSFTEPVKLGPAEPFLDVKADATRTYRDMGISAASIPVYMSRVHQMDYDRDGKVDLAFWNRDHFDVHLQDGQGSFDREPVIFTADVPFDSDGVYSRAADSTDEGVMSLLFGFNKKTERTVLRWLADLDGDRVADLVTQSLEGRSFLRQRSRYEVHFGVPASDKTWFEPHAGASVRPRGRAGAMQPWGYSSQLMQDFDGDGQVDIMFRDVRVGFGGMARAMIGNSVPIDLEFFRMEDGRYPDEPTTRRKIRRFAPFAGIGNVFLPPVMMGDVNGDGRSDLLVGEGPRELRVFLGVPGPELLARKPQKVSVGLPSDERNTWLVDLNRDGKQDVFIRHTPTDRKPTETYRVTMLLAR